MKIGSFEVGVAGGWSWRRRSAGDDPFIVRWVWHMGPIYIIRWAE